MYTEKAKEELYLMGHAKAPNENPLKIPGTAVLGFARYFLLERSLCRIHCEISRFIKTIDIPDVELFFLLQCCCLSLSASLMSKAKIPVTSLSQ